MDYRLALISGIDIPFPQCQLVIHQPTISEIAFIGDTDFFMGVQCLCLYKSMFVEDKNLLLNVNNFQIFMMIMQDASAKNKKEAVKKVLTLLFPNKQVLFTPQSILLNEDNNSSIIDATNFEDLQEILRKVFCMDNAAMDQQTFNPKGAKAKEIAQKLMRGRERIAEERNDKNSSIFSQYLSILTIGLHISLNELIKLTMFQLYDLIERYHLWIGWDLDVRLRLSGGKPEDKVENWMKNIH